MVVRLSKYFDKFGLEGGDVIKNASYLIIAQGVSYLVPLLTLGIIISNLGLEVFGQYSLTMIIVACLTVVIDYGFVFTSSKDIANAHGDKNEISRIYIGTNIIKLILLFIVFIFYVLTCNLFITDDKLRDIYLIAYCVVLAQAFFPLWFFQGIQKMKTIALLSVMAKVVTCAMIYVFVNGKDDVELLLISQAVPMLIVSIIANLLIVKTYIIYHRPDVYYLKKMFSNGGHLFIANVSSTLLTNSTLPILALYSTPLQLGTYSAIERIFKAIYGLFSPITQAIYPYNCKKFSTSVNDGFLAVYRTGIPVLILGVLTPIIMYVIAYLFFPNLVREAWAVFLYLSLWLFFGVVNNILGIQMLCALNYNKFYSKSFIISAILTISCMFLFAYSMQGSGAALAIFIGEAFLSLILFLKVLKIQSGRYKNV